MNKQSKEKTHGYYSCWYLCRCDGTRLHPGRLTWSDSPVRVSWEQHVIGYFMRAFTCALSRKNVTQLHHLYSTRQARHAEVLVIVGGSRAEAEQLATTLHAPFPVLADVDRELYRRYGLEKVLSLWQRSGTIVVNTQGQVSYLHPTTIPARLDEAVLMKTLESETVSAKARGL